MDGSIAAKHTTPVPDGTTWLSIPTPVLSARSVDADGKTTWPGYSRQQTENGSSYIDAIPLK
jgi:hypothetical protein